MSDIKQQIAMTVLNEMMRSSFFSICAVNDAADVLGANPRLSESYTQLKALHCVHWDRMPRAVRLLVPQMIADCLALPPQFTLTEERPVGSITLLLPAIDAPEKKSLTRRIMERLSA